MSPENRTKLLELGTELSPAMLGGTSQLMAGIAAPADPDVTVLRDRQYGPDERNRLDIFTRGSPENAPVLVYVHGGGFVMGDKITPGSPFYDNVGQWAAQQGYVGVTMTYRLAPAHQWPAGPQDMADAVDWLRTNIAQHGGNPDAIFLMGQSAGASHVAAYLAHPQFHLSGGPGVAGGLLISCIYDTRTAPLNNFAKAYYGEDPETYAGSTTTPGLLAGEVPLLCSVSEFDAEDFRAQAAQFTGDWHADKGTYPPMEYLAGHNHLTPAQAIGSVEDDLGPRIARFIAATIG